MSAGLLWLLPGQASAARLPFKPGHYVGVTNQTCPAEPVLGGVCQAGQKLPISFTLTKRKLSHIKATVIEQCQGEPAIVIHTMNYPQAWDIGVKTRRALFVANNAVIRHSAVIANDQLAGSVKGTSAHGPLASLITIDAQGQLDPNGGIDCNVRNLHWRAHRQ